MNKEQNESNIVPNALFRIPLDVHFRKREKSAEFYVLKLIEKIIDCNKE